MIDKEKAKRKRYLFFDIDRTLTAGGYQKSYVPESAKLALAKDIDFTGYTWTPVDSHVDFGFYISEINGNGHTISNLTINGQAMFTRFAGSGDVTVKNITFS